VEPELTIATLPIEGLKASELHDNFEEIHNGPRHEAIDIIAPNGAPAHAVVDGTIRTLFFSKAGGNTIYEFDQTCVYCYYYAHLDQYADGLYEGMHVSRNGDRVRRINRRRGAGCASSALCDLPTRT